MREIALHILDLIQNSIAAFSKKVFLDVNEDEEGYFVFRICDVLCRGIRIAKHVDAIVA